MSPEILNFLIQAGLPAGLGVIVVYYLLQHHLPREQALYSESLKSQQVTFREALLSEQKIHSELMKQLSVQHRDSLTFLRDSFVDEHTRTRVALDRLSEQTAKLSEAVFTLQGKGGS
ncbi:hypothetical protein K0U83_03835 [bacterium]|mgnify:FL=1|nr:hypothetical protein [bacterium]